MKLPSQLLSVRDYVFPYAPLCRICAVVLRSVGYWLLILVLVGIVVLGAVRERYSILFYTPTSSPISVYLIDSRVPVQVGEVAAFIDDTLPKSKLGIVQYLELGTLMAHSERGNGGYVVRRLSTEADDAHDSKFTHIHTRQVEGRAIQIL